VELSRLGTWKGDRPIAPAVLPPSASAAGGEQAVRLATWHQLLDCGRMQDGEPYLAGTARPVVARLSAATAAEAGVADGDKVTVSSAAGSVTVPVAVTPMADGVVWLPANSPGSAVRADLIAGHGSRVTLRRPE
jgi:NADH-quinone oxidoreductase subunit G